MALVNFFNFSRHHSKEKGQKVKRSEGRKGRKAKGRKGKREKGKKGKREKVKMEYVQKTILLMTGVCTISETT